MKNNCFFGFWGLFIIGFMCAGCTSVAGNVESAVSFPTPIPVNDLLIGSFTYNINDTYIVRPDGSCILEPTILNDKRSHEAYYEEAVLDSEGNQRIDSNGKPMTRIVMKNDYHIASYNELYAWAIRRAAENTGITHIIAIKSFLTTTTTNVAGMTVSRQDITLTIYGEPLAK